MVPIDQTVRSGLFYGLQKRLQSGTGLDRGQSRPINYCKKGVILKTGSGSGNGIQFLGKRSINCCEKGLPVSIFGTLELARFRISYVIDHRCVHDQPNNQPALAAVSCLAPSVSLHWSLALFEPDLSRNKLKLIITISYGH